MGSLSEYFDHMDSKIRDKLMIFDMQANLLKKAKITCYVIGSFKF